jgi:hypothetical protein
VCGFEKCPTPLFISGTALRMWKCLLFDLFKTEPEDFLDGVGDEKLVFMFVVENTVGLNVLAADKLVRGDFLFSEKFTFISFVDRTGLKVDVVGVLLINFF